MKNIIICGICGIIVSTMLAVAPHIISGKGNVSSNIEDNIYATISFGDGDAIIDMDSVESIYDFADVVVVGTITEKCDATISDLSPNPYTPYNMKVEKVIKGENVKEDIQFYVAGGTVTVKDFIDNTKNTWERSEKMGLTKLTEQEQKTKYVRYISNHTKQYEVGDTYVMILASCADSNYTVIDDNGALEIGGYDIIDSVNTKSDVLNVADIISSGKDLSSYKNID